MKEKNEIKRRRREKKCGLILNAISPRHDIICELTEFLVGKGERRNIMSVRVCVCVCVCDRLNANTILIEWIF